ncbi:MAG: NAD(P)-dependent malic enzyme [Patescibacteria group bacterium]
MGIYEQALEMHRQVRGKLRVAVKVPIRNEHDLSLAYSPGVAEPCRRIKDDPDQIYKLTGKGNTIAVVTDGSAVLGLGNIGPSAALPVMEGKCVLFKAFGGVDAIPLCLDTQDPDEIVAIVKRLEPSFAGINLEDIAAPSCFVIERRLKEETGMAIFHDDQHGTAVVTIGGLLNALKLVGKELVGIRVAVNGAGAAGTSIVRMLLDLGVEDILVCDRKGLIHEGRDGLDPEKRSLAALTNRRGLRGGLAEAMAGADVFIGVSVGNVVNKAMVRSMAPHPLIFALANPEPEIDPAQALAAGARAVATGRSDYPNQVNNVLGFPGIFRGALDVRAKDINEPMKLAAAYAIAELIPESELRPDYIIPKPFDPRVAPNVARAVAKAAMDSGVARMRVEPDWVAEHARRLVAEG